MNYLFCWIGWVLLSQSTEVPYKPADEFEVKIDVQIKARPNSLERPPQIDFTETIAAKRAKQSNVPEPFLAFKIKFLKLSGQEVKMRILTESGASVYHKKAIAGGVINLEMGFIKDIKDGVVSREYQVLLLSPEKKPVSRVHIFIEKDGTYLVNEVVCGKF